MSGTENSTLVWYLARDGQQYGPVTEIELRKLVELGQLLETDLVWNETYSDWQPASVAIETYRPAAPPPPVTPRPAPNPAPTPDHSARAPHPQPQPSQAPNPAYGHPGMAGGQPGGPAGQSFGGPGQPGPDRTRAHPQATYADPAAATSVHTHLQHNPSTARHGMLDDDDETNEPRSGSFGFKALAAGIVLALLGGGGWFAYQNSAMLGALVDGASQSGSNPPVVRAENSDNVSARPVTTQSLAPVDPMERVAFLRSPVWQGVAETFPDWASKKVEAAGEMIRAGDDEQKVTSHLIGEFAKLRREHANAALAASPAVLRSVANAFLTNLRTLTGRSHEMCYEFISRGETSPQLVPLLDDPQINQPLNKQLLTVVNAIADGRQNPQTYLPPRKSDYSLISNELNKMGWTGADMRLFGDPKQLAAASPDKVCKLVTDWFTAQLMISDQAIQSRLLVQSLRPVVAG